MVSGGVRLAGEVPIHGAKNSALKLMAAEPNLIKRPLLVRGQRVVYGFDEDAFKTLLAADRKTKD